MPTRSRGGRREEKLVKNDNYDEIAHVGVESGEESTMEIEDMTPISKVIAASMENTLDRSPSSLQSGESMEQRLADFTPLRSEAGSEDTCTPSVGLSPDEEAMSAEKQKKAVQYSLEKFFFGKQVKPAIEEHSSEILKHEVVKQGRGMP